MPQQSAPSAQRIVDPEQAGSQTARPSPGHRAALAASWALFLLYLTAVINNLRPYWFNRDRTSGDALQQLFPFHSVVDPELFRGDLIYTSMKGYLAPLHWALGAAVTKLTLDPVMTGHWLMLFQLVPAAVLFFLAVRRWSNTLPAIFALAWFLHTRPLLHVTANGLPRGWFPLILSAYLFFISRRSHWGVISTIGIGSLFNPTAAFLGGVSYSFFLLAELIRNGWQGDTKRAVVRLALASPLLIVLAFSSVSRPPEIGKMYSLEEASRMSAFSRGNGRFGFLPFSSPAREISLNGNHAFYHHLAGPPQWYRENIAFIALGVLLLAALAGAVKRVDLIPRELLAFLGAIFFCYFAARVLAFRLYVPERYITGPISLLFVAAFPVLLWRVQRILFPHRAVFRFAGFALLAALIVMMSGSGLFGTTSFRIRLERDSSFYHWVRQTPRGTVLAGNPTDLDPLPLATARRAYITTETAHPFYDRYFEAISDRLTREFRAYYSTELSHLARYFAGEKVDYFVYRKADFHPDVLARAGYFGGFNRIVKQLASRKRTDYAFVKLQQLPPEEKQKLVVFEDGERVVLNVNALRSSTRP